MIYEFGEFCLDKQRHELCGANGTIALEPKAMALLNFLVAERHRAVTKQDIFEAIWPGIFVTDASLSTLVKQIRKVLGDDGERQAFIKTVRGHGFHFVAEVREIRSAQAAAPVETLAPATKPTIAIRPFQLLGHNPTQQAVAEAIPAELIATLSRLRWINVIARGSSFRFGPGDADTADMAEQLGAQYVVSGLVEWHADGLAIFTELSDTRTGQVIWTERISGKIDDVYDMRARVARELVIALELRLPMHEADRLTHVPSENLDAWGHYHLGIRHLYRYNRADNQIAAGHFGRAIELDKGFARAYGGLSYTEFQNAFQHFGMDVDHHRRLTLNHAEEALKLDPLDPFCNLIYGRAKWLSGDAEDGLIWVDRSLELNPNYAFGYYNNATLNTVLCNSELADQNVDHALILSPLDPHLQSMFGTRALAAWIGDDPAAARRYAERALKSPNPHLYVFIIAAAIYAQRGEALKAQDCVDAIRAKQVPFGTKEFLTHFNLRRTDKLSDLVSTLAGLGI
ncbi:winged helix-turn-helix domain-containing protein [Defluviimonas aestuarii]|uniref:winged helix-turn-helix domain-containing tetratricopeptide repeat protein n=1 Tax=Albidovulum aestuarii TaxID=1130726 RepID=UPI00249B391C|nr:winged helix-turn-helix domain-containing protein [Defluviimonas aestuarii]MDI3337966.1 winged helix-turn-helix domain-containing protein [Defluviimonas aestuarii]